MNNIEPWCISRQLWWGHQIPAWYGPDKKIFVAKNEIEAKKYAKKYYKKDIKLFRDQDVLDTWFSSGLWAFATLGWPVKNDYIKDTIDKIREKNEDQDFFSAIKICKKKRIGPSRDENNRPLFFKNDIGILARSGFDFETSKRVMDLNKNEYLKIINLL